MPVAKFNRNHRGVRFNRTYDTFEMQCPDCDQYLPIDIEFWNGRKGVTRCKSCWVKYSNNAEKERREKIGKEAIAAANAAYYQENKKLIRFKDNRRKAERKAA